MELSIIIFAVSLSIDALGVGLAYGLRKIRVPLASKLIICFFSIVYSGIALLIGSTLSSILPAYAAKLIGVSILVVMGVWIIIQAMIKNDPIENTPEAITNINRTLFELAIKSLGVTIKVIKNPVEGDIDKSGTIDKTESLLLGLALSIDAIGVGIGSSLAGFSSIFIPLAVGLCQLGFLFAGTYIGSKFVMINMINRKVLAFIPGVLLLFLALVRMY